MRDMELTWYERAVLKTLRELYQFSRNFIHTRIVADCLDKNDRIIRGVLVRLEQKQAVLRKGQRGGWKPLDARAMLPAAPSPAKIIFAAPEFQCWQPRPPTPKQPPNPIMLTEYLSDPTLQAVI